MLLCCLPLAADQVVLKNGDRVTGKIVKKDGATLSIKSDLMGDVTVKWENVASVASDEPLVVVGPGAEGATVRGKVATAEGQVEIADPSGEKRIPLGEVAAVRDAAEQARYERYLHPPITALWAGYFDIGFASAQGNARTTVFTTAANATRATSHDSTNLHFNQIFSRGLVNGQLAETAKAVRGGWNYNRNLTTKIFVNVFNDYEYDAFQSLDLRVVVGGGLGWMIWKGEKGQFATVAGGNYDRDKFDTPLVPATPTSPAQFTRQSGEFYWGDDFAYKFGALSSLTQSFRMFNNLTSTGDYRANFDLGINTRLKRWLSWQITASDRYLTNPAPGKKTNDLLLSSGFRITFTH